VRHSPNPPQAACQKVILATGEGFAGVLGQLLAAAGFDRRVQVAAVKNRFFGGNVNVAGLLTASDLLEHFEHNPPAASSPTNATSTLVLIPAVLFNDDGVTLDNYSAAQLSAELKCPVQVVDCNAQALYATLLSCLGAPRA
jgi:NifB/MoaA-like Fe-S oxidoreductase